MTSGKMVSDLSVPGAQEQSSLTNYRQQQHEKRCANCEHVQFVPMFGGVCEKKGGQIAINIADGVCDDWETQMSARKTFTTGFAVEP